MANLKEIRNRITSVSSTQQITKAMKMVSAAKLRRAQDAIVQMRPYANKLKDILENLSSTLDGSEGIYSETREVKNVLLIPITSNRGLCGAFNNNVIKKASYLATHQYANAKVSMLCIGKKSDEFFKKTEYHIIGSDLPRHLNELFDHLTFDHVAPVAQLVMNAFVNKQFDKVIIIYNQFKNAATQILVNEPFLPIVAKPIAGNAGKNDFIYEPGKAEILETLIPRILKTQIFKSLLDSFASEHGARMIAMDKATDNAGELIKALKLEYNRARQSAITTEISEIVGGAAALSGS